MAYCEKCGMSGHDMREMSTDPEKKIFVGPCCVTADPAKIFEKSELSYGFEVSSHMGIKAYAQYGGLAIEFRKTKEDIQEWLEQRNQTQDRTQEMPPEDCRETQPSSTMTN